MDFDFAVTDLLACRFYRFDDGRGEQWLVVFVDRPIDPTFGDAEDVHARFEFPIHCRFQRIIRRDIYTLEH